MSNVYDVDDGNDFIDSMLKRLDDRELILDKYLNSNDRKVSKQPFQKYYSPLVDDKYYERSINNSNPLYSPLNRNSVENEKNRTQSISNSPRKVLSLPEFNSLTKSRLKEGNAKADKYYIINTGELVNRNYDKMFVSPTNASVYNKLSREYPPLESPISMKNRLRANEILNIHNHHPLLQ